MGDIKIHRSSVERMDYQSLQKSKIAQRVSSLPAPNVLRLLTQKNLNTILELYEGLGRICLNQFLPDEPTKLKTTQRWRLLL